MENKEFTYPEPAGLAEGRIGEKMIVNLGPSHPATHGVLRLKLELDGDLITRCDPMVGYVHRGQEKMAENLTDYLKENGIKVRYMHSDIDTLERIDIVNGLRGGEFDVLCGINLLREGLDMPEVKLVAILDADKEGFLRSDTSLIQTIGRAARNAEGHVIMYADTITDSMRSAIEETNRRRSIQQKYNEEHGITPTTIKKAVRDLIAISKAVEEDEDSFKKEPESMDEKELKKLAGELEKKMRQAAAELNFEEAARLRDRMIEVKKMLLDF